MESINKRWDDLIKKLEKQFDDEMTLKGILYLIGIQELNFENYRFSREEKLDVLHVATCRVLCSFGYYKFDSIDEDGWPHFTELKAVQNLTESQQGALMQEAILKYLD